MGAVLIYLLVSGITLEPDLLPCSDASCISVDTVLVGSAEYHVIGAVGCSGWGDGLWAPGTPLLPSMSTTVLLPPDTEIDSLEITLEHWATLPGVYNILPRQRGFTDDTLFIGPDSALYCSPDPFPMAPVQVSRQGSAMGYSVATVTGTPLRYYPATGTLQVLTDIRVETHTSPSCSPRSEPSRETRWSSEMRTRGITALVCNPQDLRLYSGSEVLSLSGRSSPLEISESPSGLGDCVDMVIVTDNSLEDAFLQLARHRTSQGIVTTVRTVEWIEQHYSGCDTPERIRNFLVDAHENWGIQAVLLGGDDWIVPVRQCNGWEYTTYPFPVYQMPSDDYYGDIDGDWTSDGGMWSAGYLNGYLDLCVGRWPVDQPADVDSLFRKLLLYEQPDQFPEDYARSLLLLGSNDICGSAADDMMELCALLDSSLAVPLYLDQPTELYYPHTLPAGDLCRNNALAEFDRGYNLILHADHSETHKLATAGKNTLGQYMWDSDFATMENQDRPSILWTLGCGPGHFDGADCFVETGLTTSSSSGLIAAIANARYGLFNQKLTYFVFCDALFNTGYCRQQHGMQTQDWPLSYLGEAHRLSKNTDGISFLLLNFLGPPLMQVWRDDPVQLHLTVPPTSLVEGVPADIRAIVTDGSIPVPGATVCLWKEGEVFCLEMSDEQGEVIFRDIEIKDANSGQVIMTALMHRTGTGSGGSTVVSRLPSSRILEVLPASVPVLSLDCWSVNDGGDRQANPGEAAELLLTARNSGGEPAQCVIAGIELVSGGQYIDSITDSTCTFPVIHPDCSAGALDPLEVIIAPDAPCHSVAEFRVTFSCQDGTGAYSWESPLFLTVYSDEYLLTVMEPVADNSSQDSAVVTMDNLTLVNCGQGQGSDLRLTVDNVFPPEVFSADTVCIAEIPHGEVLELTEALALIVNPEDPSSSWLQEGFPRCTFDLVVVRQGVPSIARSVDVGQVFQLQGTEIVPPHSGGVYEAGQSSLSLVWEHQGPPDAVGYYLYIDDGTERSRVYPLPLPVTQATVDGLLPGSRYRVDVTAIDPIGRESTPLTCDAGTPRPVLSGWPMQLEGSAGGGAAVSDVDMDGSDELIVSSSFGRVYIIERDGSHQVLLPPAGYDYDRFLGCAVGNVDGEAGNEIVVSCQRYIEIEGQEQVGIILYKRSGGLWTATDIASTRVNQQAESPFVAGTPVLFQADRGGSLEIALRTKGHFGTQPHLYVWRMEQSGEWVNFGSGLPLDLTGYFYSEPTAVDYDGDGLEELLVTEIGSGAGTAITIVDFQQAGVPSITTRNLVELDTGGEAARVFGTLAAAQQDGCFYVSGVASSTDPDKSVKKLFSYTFQDLEGDMTFVWATDWLTGSDFFGNMPGPSIGDPDGDGDLDVIYLLNGGSLGKEGFLYAWDLGDGSLSYTSDGIPFNPIIEDGGQHIRSQPVTGAISPSGTGGTAVLSGYSTLLCCHRPDDPAMVRGFPVWSRDGSWSAPVLCDLDDDGYAEVFHIDYSGMASLYGLGEYEYSGEGWHMYQDNPLRTGFYNTAASAGALDLTVENVQVPDFSGTDEDGYWVQAVVRVSGTGRRTCGSSEDRPETAEIAVLTVDGRRAGSSRVVLEDGLHFTRIPVGNPVYGSGYLRVVADPDDELREWDEDNNETTVASPGDVAAIPECALPSPVQGCPLLSLNLSSELSPGLEVGVYSMDGRMVGSLSTGVLPAGRQTIRVSSDPLPAGVYTVMVRGLPSGEYIRKIVVINR